MRITNSMMRNTVLSNLNTNMERLDKYQRQMSSQKRITKLSDDPVGVITAMQARAKMSQLDRNMSAIRDAQTWVDNADYAYQDMEKVFREALSLVTDLGSDENNDSDREKGAEVLKQLMEQLVQTANASVGGQYMFAGFDTDNPPFKVDENGNLLYNGMQMHPAPADTSALDAEAKEVIKFQIGYGLEMDVTFTGVKLMGVGDNNLYGMLQDAYNDMVSGKSAEEVGKHIGKLQQGLDSLLSQSAEIGGRQVRLDMLGDRYEQEQLNYQTRLTLVEDIDISEAYMNYSSAMNVYEAALQTGAKIIQPTLMDYIR